MRVCCIHDTVTLLNFSFILDRNLAKTNCTENHVCTSCDKVVLEMNLFWVSLLSVLIGYPSSLVSASGASTPSYVITVEPTVTTPSAAGAGSSYSSYHSNNAYPSASNSVSSYQSQSTYSSNSLSSTVAGLAADRAGVQKSLSSVKPNTLSQASKVRA